MRTKVEDLIGFNLCEVDDMPLAESCQQVEGYLHDSSAVMSIAGMRHCQGGQAAVPDQAVGRKRMLLTETMNRMVSIDVPNKTVTVQGGATWSEVHQYVGPHGLAPKVHQSSAHFTVGGSISVNCHGRDPRWGPISNTVVSMKVLCGTGETLDTSPTDRPDLFGAVIGGYGSCGLILEATLELCENSTLLEHKSGFIPADDWNDPAAPFKVSYTLEQYAADYLSAFEQGLFDQGKAGELELHHAWLHLWIPRFQGQPGPDQRRQVFQVSLKREPVSAPIKETDPQKYADEGWGVSEIMRAGWSAAHTDSEVREIIWRIAKEGSPLVKEKQVKPMRINYLRSPVSFTAHRGEQQADILLEYFLPVSQFVSFVDKLIALVKDENIFNVLSSTVRLVKQDQSGSNLSFCPDGPVVSLAIDVSIPIDGNARTPKPEVLVLVNQLTAAAIDMGGTYYLPYYKFADKSLFDKAYNSTAGQRARFHAQMQAITTYNPRRIFWSAFLEKYF